MDRNTIINEIQNNGLQLQDYDENIRNDREIVMLAVRSCGWALEYASERLKNDKEIVSIAVEEFGYTLEYASDELKDCKELVKIAVENDGSALEYASEKLKGDKEIVLIAVEEDGDFLKYASEELKDCREVVKIAVENDGSTLLYASERLKDDKEIVLIAIEDVGRVLKYASERLRNDKEVVLLAVENDGCALEYASERLRNDKEVVLLAVENDGRALKYAFDDLRCDEDCISVALDNDEDADKYVLCKDSFELPFQVHEIEKIKQHRIVNQQSESNHCIERANLEKKYNHCNDHDSGSQFWGKTVVRGFENQIDQVIEFIINKMQLDEPAIYFLMKEKKKNDQSGSFEIGVPSELVEQCIEFFPELKVLGFFCECQYAYVFLSEPGYNFITACKAIDYLNEFDDFEDTIISNHRADESFSWDLFNVDGEIRCTVNYFLPWPEIWNSFNYLLLLEDGWYSVTIDE